MTKLTLLIQIPCGTLFVWNTGMNRILPHKEVGPVFVSIRNVRTLNAVVSVHFRSKFPVKKFRSVGSGFNRRCAIHS